MRYLRPGQVFLDFLVEHAQSGVDGHGRPVRGYDAEHPVLIRAAIASADAEARERYSRPEHPVTHSIVHLAPPVAEVDDRMVRGDRHYYVNGVEDPGGLGLWAIYYVEERRGVDASG